MNQCNFSLDLLWSSDVTKEEAATAISAIASVVRILPGEGKFQINTIPGGLESYEQRAEIAERNQLYADRILTDFLFQRKEAQWKLAVSARSITSRNNGGWLNFLFGLSGRGVAIVSTHQFRRELKDEKLRLLCLRRTIVHEFCHSLGLIPDSRKTNRDERLGLHCTNVCVMRQGLSVKEWAGHARQEEERGVILCPQCAGELISLWSG